MPTILLFNFIKTRLLLLPENYPLDNFAQDSCAETVKLSTQSIYLHVAHTYKIKKTLIDSKSFVRFKQLNIYSRYTDLFEALSLMIEFYIHLI